MPQGEKLGDCQVITQGDDACEPGYQPAVNDSARQLNEKAKESETPFAFQDFNDHDYDSQSPSFAKKLSLSKQMSQDEISQKLDINMGYCFWYTFVFGVGTWQTAWAMTGNANTVPVFEAKFGWTKDETMLYNTIISTAAVVGITVGSFLGGVLLKFGRRRTVIIS